MSEGTMTVDLKGCARCWSDEGSEQLAFAPLTHPVPDPDGEFTHWAPCPVNGEPILLRVDVDG